MELTRHPRPRDFAHASAQPGGCVLAVHCRCDVAGKALQEAKVAVVALRRIEQEQARVPVRKLCSHDDAAAGIVTIEKRRVHGELIRLELDHAPTAQGMAVKGAIPAPADEPDTSRRRNREEQIVAVSLRELERHPAVQRDGTANANRPGIRAIVVRVRERHQGGRCAGEFEAIADGIFERLAEAGCCDGYLPAAATAGAAPHKVRPGCRQTAQGRRS